MLRTYLVAVSFWIHLLSIMMWVGAILIVPLVAWPAAQTLEEPQRQQYKDAFLRRLTPWMQLALPLILMSGLTQIYLVYGFRSLLSINTLSLKLLVFILMFLNNMRGIRLRDQMHALRATGSAITSDAYLQLKRREARTQWIEVGLVVLILLLTGFLTAGIFRL